jgi:hypothetical protein
VYRIIPLLIPVVATLGCANDGPQPDDAPATDTAVSIVKPEPIEEPAMPEPDAFPRELNETQRAILTKHDWNARVQQGLGVWVSVSTQTLRVVQADMILWDVSCATAEKGTGNVMDSFQTPLGWHHVEAKTGADAPKGQVFKGGVPINRIWEPGQETDEDLVLTRILFLGGLEPGYNQGGNVDSRTRCIYIHGTNDEDRIGEPSSHGCVRLLNDDVIEAYEQLPVNTPVLITEESESGTP